MKFSNVGQVRLSQTKDYEIGIFCFSTKHTADNEQSWVNAGWNQDKVSEQSDMSTLRTVVSVRLHYNKNLAQCVGLQIKADII